MRASLENYVSVSTEANIDLLRYAVALLFLGVYLREMNMWPHETCTCVFIGKLERDKCPSPG